MGARKATFNRNRQEGAMPVAMWRCKERRESRGKKPGQEGVRQGGAGGRVGFRQKETQNCCTAGCFASGCRSTGPERVRISVGPAWRTWVDPALPPLRPEDGSSAEQSHLEGGQVRAVRGGWGQGKSSPAPFHTVQAGCTSRLASGRGGGRVIGWEAFSDKSTEVRLQSQRVSERK